MVRIFRWSPGEDNKSEKGSFEEFEVYEITRDLKQLGLSEGQLPAGMLKIERDGELYVVRYSNMPDLGGRLICEKGFYSQWPLPNSKLEELASKENFDICIARECPWFIKGGWDSRKMEAIPDDSGLVTVVDFYSV